ncbi:telomeric repeat-binding factor 1 isoform X2 [Nothobranchius furzeri]|uniref:telomeric repeat-binding factor 1 isoform X2 n=1 Tax=Nothobranchius furzeri TaxID=105023 RepID=UPI002403B372|nr:telomeric repeat-binding factor 1 isoform X2 [Nothobranchius furzeri]
MADEVSVCCTTDESIDKTVSFSRVSAVATEWMFDYFFVSLCRCFKERKRDEFNEMLSVFEVISENESLKGTTIHEKTLICALLVRVIDGKCLDELFDKDRSIMPLMSAAKVWLELKDTVGDESLFKSITSHLLIQSVAVCLEKGQTISATCSIEWFKKHVDIPRSLARNLSTIVQKKETYHSLFNNFSLNRLMETIQTFLDSYLKKHPSDYLLKAATKVAQSAPDIQSSEEAEPQDDTFSKSSSTSVQKKKRKRNLLSTLTDVWTPEPVAQPFVCIRRLSKHEISQMTSPAKFAETSTAAMKRRKWTSKLDKFLEQGVRRHGVGKWAQILNDYDFEGRTSVMLKDRWRVLIKSHQVG